MLRGFGLRSRLALLVVSSVAIAALTAAMLGAAALGGLSGLTQEQAAAAMLREVEQSVLSRAEEQARAEDLSLDRARALAETLAMYSSWLYKHPDYFPGFLQGGSPLRRTTEGHWVNEPDTPVGVFVPRVVSTMPAIWAEVGLLSFLDPLLVAAGDASPQVRRCWVSSATGIVRTYPNDGLGHADSPVGPDHDFRLDEAYLAAASGRNPAGRPVWTRPYVDPAGHGLMVTASVPVFDAGGAMRAVCGLDLQLDAIVREVLVARAGPGGYAFLIDAGGGIVTAPEHAYVDLGLSGGTGDPGQALALQLASSELEGVRNLAADILRAGGSGIARYSGVGGLRYAGYAPLSSTGWVLVWSLPEDSLHGAAGGLEEQLTAIRQRLMGGMAAGVAVIGCLMALVGAAISRSLTRPLADLTVGAHQLGEDLSYRLPDLGPDEVGTLAAEMNTMAERLAVSTAAAVEAAEQAALERQARVVAVLGERNRMAREIHDTIAQGLAGVVIGLQNVSELISSGSIDEASRTAAGAAALARATLADARRSVWSLRPEPVLELGLAGALRQAAENYAASGFRVDLELEEGLVLGAEAEDALFRVALEALANSFRHSGVPSARIELRRGRSVTLSISDDGCGFNPEKPHGSGQEDGSGRRGAGFGLWAMDERMIAVGGSLAVRSAPGKGACIVAQVPLDAGQGPSHGV